MSGGGGLHAEQIDCLLSRLLVGVRLLGVFARDDLPGITSEIRPWCLILNTDPKDQPGTHWLALYTPKENPIELFDSFGFLPINYSLDSLNPLHLVLISSRLALLYVATTVLFISIFVLVINH